jgi:hypothetical protein
VNNVDRTHQHIGVSEVSWENSEDDRTAVMEDYRIVLIKFTVSNLYSSLLQMIFPQVMGNYIFKVLAVNTARKKITNSLVFGVSGSLSSL